MELEQTLRQHASGRHRQTKVSRFWSLSILVLLVDPFSRYTHMHWAFIDIDPNTYKLIPNNTWGQWDRFKALTGIKKVISIGGWGFSTELKTYDILRKAMTGENNKKFAQNILDFLNGQSLYADGIKANQADMTDIRTQPRWYRHRLGVSWCS